MPVKRDLGFYPFIWVFFICLLIILLFKRKWKIASEREEEIRRLLIKASQETHRVEVEAYQQYISASPIYSFHSVYADHSNHSVTVKSQCAVCFLGTNTRCARCKAVHYCSGKCQIMHWRQGHKDQCRPPAAVKQEHIYEVERSEDAKPFKKPSGKPVLSSSSHSPKFRGGGDDDQKAKPRACEEERSTSDVSSSDYLTSDRLVTSNIKRRKNNVDDAKSTFHVVYDGNSSKTRDFREFSFNLSGNAIHESSSNGAETKPAAALKPKEASSVSTTGYRGKSITTEVDRSTSRTSNIPNSIEAGAFSNGSTGVHLPSNTSKQSVLNARFGNIDGNHIRAGVSRYPTNISNGLKSSFLKVVDQIIPSKLPKQPLGDGREISKSFGYKGQFPYELFVKLYNLKVELRPCGLINCGNSCYANVVLQCLAFTPPLTAYLLQGMHSRTCRKRGWCFTCEFERLVLKVREGRSPLSPNGILSHIGKISSKLGNGKQEDAHEFLRYVIDTMQSICVKESGITGSKHSGEETTIIDLTFGGHLRSKIMCMKCNGKSEQREGILDLTVEIEGEIGCLEEALRKFTSTEILDDGNKYECSRCKSFEKAKKKITILETPNVLTIALKRFQLGKFGKLNKSIEFPETLDLGPYMTGTSDKSPIYSLYGVVVHLDVMNAAFSGHYVCYVKNFQDKWFKLDDSNVKSVDLETVLRKGAYMLLYARCTPRLPKSLWNSDVNVDGMDSSSDNSSLISGSDESSYSTESSSSRYSSTGDFSDYIS